MHSKKLTTTLVSVCLIIVLAVMVVLPACAAPAPAAKPAPSPTPAPTAQTFKWRIQHFSPPALELYTWAFMKWIDMVKENTNGRVTIEPYSAPALVPTAEVFKAAGDGLIDGMFHVGQYNIGIWPGFGVEDSMPMAYSEARDQVNFMWGDDVWKKPYEDFIRPYHAKYGVYYLTSMASDYNFLLTRKPVRTVADLKGLKIRSTGMYAKFLTELGATTVNVPLAEVYTGLATGTFDGMTTGTGGHVGLKIYEHAKYAWWPALNGMVVHIALSMKSWDKLPPDLKTVVRLTSRDFAEWQNRVYWYKASFPSGIDFLKSKGVEFLDFTEKDKAYAAAFKVWDDVGAADADSAKAVGMLKEYMKVKGLIK